MRNDDGVRNSTWTAYGIRGCSRSVIGLGWTRLDHPTSLSITDSSLPCLDRKAAIDVDRRSEEPIEQTLEVVEVHVADLDPSGLAGRVLGDLHRAAERLRQPL